MDHPELRELLLILYSGRIPTPAARKDFEGRELIATPFDGHYGLAGWIIAVNGSPPRGVVVSLETREHRYVPASVFYLEMDKSRRLGTAQADIVRRFIDTLPPLESADRNALAKASRVRESVADSSGFARAALADKGATDAIADAGAERESQESLDTYLIAEIARLTLKLEALKGGPLPQRLAVELAELTRRAEWYALLANAFQQRVLAIDADGYLVEGYEHGFDSREDANGLPEETPELRSALESSLTH